MQTSTLKTVLGHLLAQAGAEVLKDLSDTDLLERFRGRREEAAFALLVQRHGPMVLGVCRRVLGDLHAAEDAFQATFLVLVRKADSIRKQHSLASWLYGVAQRTAVRARTQSAERRRCERESIVPLSSPDALEALTRAELYAVLDEEIGRLPDKYRSPLVLCCLEGKTHEQAAQEMVWPKSSVTARLKRARELLRQRLVRRGVALPGGGVAALLAEQTAAQATSAHLTLTTVRQAAEALADQAATATTAVALAGGLVKGLTTTKMAAALALLLAVGLAVAGVGVLASPKEEPQTKTPPRQAQRAEPPKPQTAEMSRTDLYGDPLPDGALARLGTTRLRHAGAQQVVFSADGKTALSTGHDLTVRQWELSSGKLAASQSFTLSPDESFRDLSSPVLSPDRKTLAYFGEKRLYFFDATSGKELHRIPLDNDQGRKSIQRQAFTPDGKQFALTNQASEFLLFDVAAGQAVKTGVQSKRWITQFAFDANAKQLASFGDQENAVTLWEMPQGTRLHTLRMPLMVTTLAFSPDGKRLFASTANHKGFIWDTASGEKKAEFPIAGDWGFATLSVSANGAHLAVASDDGVVLRDTTTLKEIRKLTNSFCLWIWFSPDGKTLAGASGGAIHLWNVADGKPLHDAESHDEVQAVAYSPDGKRLVSAGDNDGTTYVWDVVTTKRLATIRTARLVFWAPFLFSRDGQTLLHAADRGVVKAWNVADGKEKTVFLVSEDATARRDETIASLHLSLDGNRLSAISHYQDDQFAEGDFFLAWDAASGKRLERTKLPGMSGARLTPNGRVLAYLKEGSLGLYDFAEKGTRITLPRPGFSPYRFSPDGTLLAMTEADGPHVPRPPGTPVPKPKEVSVWDTTTGKARIKLPITSVWHKTFTPDNRFLLTTGMLEYRLWELASGKEVLRRRVDGMPRGNYADSFANCVAVAPDGRSAAMGQADGNIIVWDLLPSSRRKVHLTAKNLEALWTDLAGEDAAKAYDVGGRLIAAPEPSTAFLSKYLHPIADETKRIRSLIGALNDDEFIKREAARKELEQLGLTAEPELRRTLDGKPSAETRHAVETLLADVWTVRTAEEQRQLRAVWVLEQIGSAEARQTLKRLADGAAGARQTREARSALTRLDAAK